jgi:uncharacterized protein
MASIYDIYERKNYRNKIPLAHSVNFEVEVRETNLYIQAQSDLKAKAKDSVFRYRYQIEEYLRQHPAFRETSSPIQIYASAPEIVRYTDLASRLTGVAPMSCMSGALADFIGRDLFADSPDLIISSGGDSFVHTSRPLQVHMYAEGSPLHDKIILSLPILKKSFGISTYVPSGTAHAVTVISRTASWASAYSTDIGMRIIRGESLAAILERAEKFPDIGGIAIITSNKLIVLGDMILIGKNGDAAQKADRVCS